MNKSLQNSLAASLSALVLCSSTSFGADVFAELDGNWATDIWGTVSSGTVVPGLRPGSADTARIDAGMDVTVNSNVGTVNILTLQSSGASSLTMESGAVLAVATSFGFQNNGGTRTLTLNGNSSLSVGTVLNMANGTNSSFTTVNNTATLSVAGLRVAQTGTGTLTVNGGLVRVTGSSSQTASIAGGAGGVGTLVISGGQYISDIGLTFANNATGVGNLTLSSGTMIVRGSFTKGSGTANINWTGGTLSVQSSNISINNAGTGVFAPGEVGAVGSFSVVSGASVSYTQGADAFLNLDFASDALFDTVSIGAGTGLIVNLDGTIVLNLLSGYVPTEGLTFDVITATDIVDNGFTISGNGASWFTSEIISVSGNDVLRLTAVPEPSTYALLAAVGVMGLVLRRRRS